MLDYLRHPLQGVRFGWAYPQHVETEVLAETLYILLSIVRFELPFRPTDYLRRQRESKYLSFSLWSHDLPWISPYSVVVLWNLLQHHFAQNTCCLGKIGLLRVSYSLHQFCFYRVVLRDSEEIEGWNNFPSRQWHKQIVWVSVCLCNTVHQMDISPEGFVSFISFFNEKQSHRDTLKFVGKKCCMFVCPSKGKNGCTKQSSVPVRKEEFTKCILTESLVLKHYIEISFEGTGRLKSLNQQINQNVNAVLVISSFQGPTNRMWKVFFLYPGNRKRTCTDICHHSATDS